MAQNRKKTSVLSRLRNYFFAGAVVLIPIGITLYLSIFIIKVSTKILPKELNPNNYLPFEIPGIEIIIAILVITFIGWLSLSFLVPEYEPLAKDHGEPVLLKIKPEIQA